MALIKGGLRYSLMLVLLASTCVVAGFGQSVTATLEGTITDATGATVSGTTVVVQNTATNITRTVISDGSGRYSVNTLNPGDYRMTAEASGFSKKELTGITLNVGGDIRLDVTLAIGGSETTITVDATTTGTDTQSSALGTVIDNHQVVELPLANRQFYALALLSPAAYQPAQNSTLGFRGGFNVAGVSEISNQFTLNGIFDNDMATAQPSFRPSVETIKEFKLLTGVYPAEYGRMAGGQVVVIEKSGGNQFHGSAYEFIRNEVTDAKPFFNPPGAKIPSFKQNTFGGTVGGPIWKNRTFFFFGYEGQRIRSAVTALATVPTTDMLSGIFATGTFLDPATGLPLKPLAGGGYNLAQQIPAEWGSVAAKAGQLIAKLGYPTPTVNTPTANNYNFSETRTENMDEESVRIDHKISDKDSIYGSWNYFKDPAFEPSNQLCGSLVLPQFGCFTNQLSTLANVTYDRVLTSSLLNELRVGFDRLVQPRTQQDNTVIGSSYAGLPGGPYFNQPGYLNNLGLPNTSVAGYSTFGGSTNLPQDRWDDHYQIVDTVNWTRGAHSFKFGADFFLVKTNNVITSSGRGALTFNDATLKGANKGTVGTSGNSLADLLLGLPYSTTIGTSAPTVYLSFESEHLFAMDDWKVTQNLTLNLGVRWELDKPVYSPHDTVARFDLPTQVFQAAGPTTFKHLYNYDYNNFAPRLGFAWQPYKKDSTVVKGAVGTFYTQPLTYNQFLGFGTQYPFRLVTTYQSAAGADVTLASAFPSSLGGNPPCGTAGAPAYNAANPKASCAAILSPNSVAPGYRTPYLNEWSLGVQQQLGPVTVLEVTYFGSKGTKLPLSINDNQINVANLPGATSYTQSQRPYPGFSSLTNQDTRASSSFQSLQTSLRQSYTKGVTYLLAYTFGKSIDQGGGIGSGSNSSNGPQNAYNLRGERGLSDFNVAHRVVFSPLAELPFGHNKAYLNHGLGAAVAGGFQVSGIFTFQTGRPFTVYDQSSNNSGTFGFNDRPNVIGNPNGVDPVSGHKPHSVAEWFNTQAYALAPKGTFGNEGRNSITGPGYVDLDLTLARNFPVMERVNGQFRIESFNLLNHPNFFNPLSQGTQFGSGAFGSITQANQNREFQFSLRLLF